MALSMFDHQCRLHDLEVALEEVLTVITAPPQDDKRPELKEAVRRLRSRGEAGAADLLSGGRHKAAYRR